MAFATELCLSRQLLHSCGVTDSTHDRHQGKPVQWIASWTSNLPIEFVQPEAAWHACIKIHFLPSVRTREVLRVLM
jgi:hypothetical protein